MPETTTDSGKSSFLCKLSEFRYRTRFHNLESCSSKQNCTGLGHPFLLKIDLKAIERILSLTVLYLISFYMHLPKSFAAAYLS
jgi:hypothetical protein